MIVWRIVSRARLVVGANPNLTLLCRECHDGDSKGDAETEQGKECPEEPTTCCMSGCPNCVWIEYAQKLSQFYKDGGEEAIRQINEKVTDPNMKAFLMHELRMMNMKRKFVSRANTFRVVIGDTVVLPCEVQNLGSLVIVWKRGITLLTAGQQKITADPRISLLGYNLQVRDIRYSDQGDYTCQIGDGSHGDLIHTVEILMPPSLQIYPNNGEVFTTRKGAPVSFECRASGNPLPVVQWSKKEGVLPSGLQVQTGYLLSLPNVQRQDAGEYQCTASNGIGQPVTGEVKLHVLYPPEISVAKSWVNAGEGLEARLDCIVHADPPGEVLWYQNSFPLQQTDRRIMSSKGKTHTLTIKNVQFSDFGNYSCTVINNIGRDRKYIELSGKPGPARIISPNYSSFYSYDLRWIVQSVLPIIEAKILYRRINTTITKYEHQGQWHDLVVKPNQKYDPKTGERIQSFLITNLIPESLYECLILTKNEHGYSEVSDLHQWFSSNKGRLLVYSIGHNVTSFSLTTIAFIQVVNFLLSV